MMPLILALVSGVNFLGCLSLTQGAYSANDATSMKCAQRSRAMRSPAQLSMRETHKATIISLHAVIPVVQCDALRACRST